MPVFVTRTLNPLPFEHLEPKRFEDLVRQLVYDFRSWRTLEATGRSGGDNGFDARAIEVLAPTAATEDDADISEEIEDVSNDRVWLIQCKREKEIGPSKIAKHLDEISRESIEGLYGIIFAAACDFSMSTRHACREWCRAKGVQEVHLWGRGEIEDQLFQPKNDNLLFAYFGISLQIRRQGAATKIRRNITLKRRIRKMQEGAFWPGRPVILRDPSDDRYPVIDRRAWNRGQFLWRPAWSCGVGVRGLRVILRQHYGYYDPRTEEWDFASGYNHVYPHEVEDRWPPPATIGDRAEVIHAWSGMPKQHQVHFRLIGILPFDEIIEVDQEPDDVSELPTIFTTFRKKPKGGFEPPFLSQVHIDLEASSLHWHVKWVPDRHVRAFPDSMRDASWEEAWTSRNGLNLSEKRIDLPVDPQVEEMRRKLRGETDADV